MKHKNDYEKIRGKQIIIMICKFNNQSFFVLFGSNKLINYYD